MGYQGDLMHNRTKKQSSNKTKKKNNGNELKHELNTLKNKVTSHQMRKCTLFPIQSIRK